MDRRIQNFFILTSGVDQRNCNLIDVDSALRIEDLDRAMIEAYHRYHPSLGQVVEITEDNTHEYIVDKAQYQSIYDRYTSHNFLYNSNPSFTHKFDQRFSFGMLEILLSCSENTISACEVFSNSLYLRKIAAIDRGKDGRA